MIVLSCTQELLLCEERFVSTWVPRAFLPESTEGSVGEVCVCPVLSSSACVRTDNVKVKARAVLLKQ